MSERAAIYAGSFDPMTNGHMDVLVGAINLFDRVVIAVGTHTSKKGLFSFDERVELIRKSLQEFEVDGPNVEIASFDGLLVDAAKANNAQALLRGLRDGTDLDYEMQMAGMNEMMAPDLQTIFIPASPSVRTITATLVRQIASMGGDIEPFVPKAVAAALRAKYS